LRVKQDEAETVLQRFSAPMGMAVSQVLRDQGLETNSNVRDELEQEARIRVITYAGLMPGWNSGILADWTRQAEQDEEQIKLLVTKQLKLNLAQILGRQLQKDCRLASLDVLLETGVEPADITWEDRVIEDIDNRSEGGRYRRLYPTLARNVFDGLTQTEIAGQDGVTVRTVERHIAREKRAFLLDYIQRRGLAIGGNETLEELAEAYENLTRREAAPFALDEAA
jgi:hypothetical protein